MKRKYYTEYPLLDFEADSDEEALDRTTALLVYREADEEGSRFVILREPTEAQIALYYSLV